MTGFLRIGSAQFQADISPYGAALARVWFDGHAQSLVLGLPNPEDYVDAPHAIGVVVGPIAGRVSGARVQIAGRSFRMEPNTPPDCLHSGTAGIQNRLWEVVEQAEHRVSLRCVLPDGACGLPGQREFLAKYDIRRNSLTLTIETHVDADTLVNATSHAYWNLDEAGDLSTHRLCVRSERMLETGPDLIPTGQVLETAGGPFDFRLPRDPTSGPPLDGCFCLGSEASQDPRPVLELSSTVSGLKLRVESNQSGVVLYTGENLPHLPAPRETPPIRPFSALAIEPQGWPDAPNQLQFPSIFVKKWGTLRQISRFSIESS